MTRASPLLLALLLSGCPRSAGKEVAATVTERDIILACSDLCGEGMIKTYKPTCLCESPEETTRIMEKIEQKYTCCADCVKHRERLPHEVAFDGMFCEEVRRP